MGLRLSASETSGVVSVVDVVPGGPAARSGSIRAGDIITEVKKANTKMEKEKYGQTLAPNQLKRHDVKSIEKNGERLAKFFNQMQTPVTIKELAQELAATSATQADTTYKNVKQQKGTCGLLHR